MATQQTMIIDDLLFVQYPYGGWQCKIKLKNGVVSVRMGQGLFTDDLHPFEVWYPSESEPSGYQTSTDVWEYIKQYS
jgi:hypothetical protein